MFGFLNDPIITFLPFRKPGDHKPHILSGEGSVSEFQNALIAGEISSEHYRIL